MRPPAVSQRVIDVRHGRAEFQPRHRRAERLGRINQFAGDRFQLDERMGLSG